MENEFNSKIEKSQRTPEKRLAPPKNNISINESVDIDVLSHNLRTIGELKKRGANRKRELTKGGKELQFRAKILEKASDPIFLRDTDNNIILVNKSASEMCGYRKGEFIGMNMQSLIVPDEIPNFQKMTKSILKKKNTQWETYILNKDNSESPVNIHSNLIQIGTNKYILSVVHDITERKQAEEALKQSRDELRKFSIYLQEQLESERKRLAAEIHDELGQMLTGLKIDLSWLSRNLPEGMDPLLQKTRSMLDIVDEIDKIAKKIAADLRPAILDDLGLPAAMKWQVKHFKAKTGIRCGLVITLEDLVLEKELSVDIFRIVQEALTNISRHAGATEVRVRLKVRGGMVVLNIRDNGRGVTREEIVNPGSFGLIGMRERARRWGGTLDIKGIPGKGTTINVRLPLDEKKK